MPRRWNATRQHIEQKRRAKRRKPTPTRDPLRRDWGNLRTHAMDVPSQDQEARQ